MSKRNKRRVVWTIKTFNDLRFRAKSITENPIAEITDFGNGYGVTVEEHLLGYDVTIMKDGEMCTKTYIANDVIIHLTADEVTEVMKKIQNLGNVGY